MHTDSFATLATSSVQSLPQIILVEDLCRPTEMEGEKAQIHQIRVGPSRMDPIILFLNDDILPEEKKLLGFGYPKIKSSTSAIFLDCICYAFILKQ